MPISDKREYRSIPIPVMETRKDDDGNMFVEGYASTFAPYLLYSWGDIDYYERIDPHAFDEADMSDVIFQRDHSGPVMARTSNGTIELTIDSHGLHQRTDLSKTESAREMFEEIREGMYAQMSFAFTIREDSYDRDTHTRNILKIDKVYDVSAVSFPANPDTNISVSTRNWLNGVIEAEEAERLRAENDKNIELLKLKLKL